MHVCPGFADEEVDAVAYPREQDEEDDDDDGDHVVLFHLECIGWATVPHWEGRGAWCCGGWWSGRNGWLELVAELGRSLGSSWEGELLELECAEVV